MRRKRGHSDRNHPSVVSDRDHPAGDVIYSIWTITPKQAAELLEQAAKQKGGFTRSPIDRFVSAYAASMKAGRWILNGMPITFGKSGRLLDGVMRLKACVLAGVPFQTVVVHDVADDILHTIDQHRRRSYLQVLQTRKDIRHARPLLRALTRLIRYDENNLETKYEHMGWAKLESYLQPNKRDLMKALDATVPPETTNADEQIVRFDHGLAASLYFMGMNVDEEATKRFIDAIYRPDRYGANEPGRIISARVEFEHDSATKTDFVNLFAVCIKALQDTIDGRFQRKYRYVSAAHQAKGGEPFPKLCDYAGLRGGPPKASLDTFDGFGVKVVRPPSFRHERHGVTISQETITPEFATDSLEHHNEGNRPLNEAAVEMIARDIENDRWQFNATPICFAKTGRLLNGQHRLSACAQTGIPIECTVVRGLDEAAFETYDVNVKRHVFIEHMAADEPRGRDNKDAAQVSDVRVLVAAAKLLWRAETQADPALKGKKPTPSELKDLLRQHPKLAEFVGYGRRASALAQASLLTYFAYQVSRKRPDVAPDFLEGLESGADLGIDSPILRLRKKLIAKRTAVKGAAKQELRDLLYTGWTAYLDSLGPAKRGNADRVKTVRRLVA